jgi:uncharacterized protein YjeT (DUF2065 family)
MPPISIILIGFGVLYLIKPDLFKRGVWKKTAITQQAFSPKNYLIYMRVLGGVFIVAGVLIWVLKK